MAGQVDFMTDQIVNVVAADQGGTIKAYAIATPERSPALPDVPTTKEAGLPDYEVSAWNAVFAPEGHAGARSRPSSSTRSTRRSTDETTKKRLLDLGGVLPDEQGRTPEALQTLVESRSRPLDAGAQGGRRRRELTADGG